jgi:transcription antitermination protein NusB
VSRPRHQARSVARLAAVQALYQMEISGAGVETIVREFDAHRFDRDLEGQTMAEADEDFFAELLRGVVERRQAIDALITGRLVEGWRLDRLDATVRAILRCGVHELTGAGTPPQVAIDEYVEIAKSFFGAGSETAFVNAVLDQTARDARAA